MVNKQNTTPPVKDTGYSDLVPVNAQCHLLIKDKDTGKVIVNQRG